MGIEEGTLTVWDWASRTQGISGPIAIGSGDLGALSTDLGSPAGLPDVTGAPALASLGRYPVAGSLGRGGMGEVILVRDPDLGRELAAKVILQSQPERVAVEKFLLEAQVTGQLEHPNIVPVHELGLDADRRLYMTMKRVRGKDLKAILDGERKASERESSSSRRRRAVRPGEAERARSSLPRLLEIFLKVCDAVAFAHSKGVIHRDLKPANVMAGEFGEVLVMDWGLAKVAGHADASEGACVPDLALAPVAREARGDAAAGEEPLQTGEGSILGTPAYMPPEQAQGEIKKIDVRSDIESLGAILYEILTLASRSRRRSRAARRTCVPPSRQQCDRRSGSSPAGSKSLPAGRPVFNPGYPGARPRGGLASRQRPSFPVAEYPSETSRGSVHARPSTLSK